MTAVLLIMILCSFSIPAMEFASLKEAGAKQPFQQSLPFSDSLMPKSTTKGLFCALFFCLQASKL